MTRPISSCVFFFFNDTATTEIYTLSLHDALPISSVATAAAAPTEMRDTAERARTLLDEFERQVTKLPDLVELLARDRKSTRLNSSHSQISYAVFCLKKKRSETELLHPASYDRQRG